MNFQSVLTISGGAVCSGLRDILFFYFFRYFSNVSSNNFEIYTIFRIYPNVIVRKHRKFVKNLLFGEIRENIVLKIRWFFYL